MKKLIENEVMETEIEISAQEGIPAGDRTEIYLKYFDLEGKESTF
jgi:hypothetical protein